jgi:hypothetical protein
MRRRGGRGQLDEVGRKHRCIIGWKEGRSIRVRGLLEHRPSIARTDGRRRSGRRGTDSWKE